MGLFSSRGDDIKKLNEQLADVDEELLYKKALKALYDGASYNTDAHFSEVVVLHHDLQEIKKAIENKK